MSNPGEEEDTWVEDFRSDRAPLEIRISVQPAVSGDGRERRETAQRLLAELMDIRGEERFRLLKERRFHDSGLLELLLETGHAALPFDVGRAVELTTLAADLGSLLQRHGDLDEAEGLSRALCLMATARRLVGDVAIADAAFEQAGRLAVSTPERGWFCRALALLRWDQGRTEEAIALLYQAGQRFAEALNFQELAACRALLGLLCLDEGQLSRAFSLLSQASHDLSGDFRPWLAAQMWLGLAYCHAAGERPDKARTTRQRAWTFYGKVKDERALLSLYWLEGRGAFLLQEMDEAAALLEEVRRKAIIWRLLPEATLGTLDLGHLWLLAGRESEVGALVAEIAATFESHPGLDLALGSLRYLGETVEAGSLVSEMWTSMAPILRMAFRLQGVPPLPVPFA
jgi:tetratricopeptide (TPR) repeat protein